MNKRLKIAKDVLAGMVYRSHMWEEALPIVLRALNFADELIKQEALTRVKKEAEEHK